MGAEWQVEDASDSIDRLIERRAREADDANRRARQFSETAMRYDLGQAAANRQAWISWHHEQAERHRHTLNTLVAHHEQAARALEAGEGEGIR